VEKLQKSVKISAAEGRPMVSVLALSVMADIDNSTSSSNEGVVVISNDQDNAKRRKVDESSDVDVFWLIVHNMQLKMSEKMILLNKEELKDRIINASQRILYYQFPSLQGLHSTLVEEDIGFCTGNYLQILHCRSSHWITVNSVGCEPG